MALTTTNRQCGSLKSKLTILEQYISAFAKPETGLPADEKQTILIELNFKMDTLKKIENDLNKLRLQYYEIAKDEDIDEIDQSLQETEQRIDKLQVSLITFIHTILNESEHGDRNRKLPDSVNIMQKPNNSISLPTIPLPTFDGTFEQFGNFKIAFENLLKCHPQLMDTQKLFYLRSCLQGKAKSIETPDDTYESLMKTLTDRFENKRILIDTHINNIINYPIIMHESAKELRELLDSVNKNLRALKLLNFERNNFSNSLLINIVMPKLDKNSRMQFELTLENQDIPDFDKFLEFIERRSQMLEAIARNVPLKTNNYCKTQPSTTHAHRSKGLFVQSQNNNNCIICKVPSHTLYKCFKFKRMSLDERDEIVRKNNLCNNCLHHSHNLANCKSKANCYYCKSSSHNSLLHRSKEVIKPTQTDLEESDNQSICNKSTEKSSVLLCKGKNKQTIINSAIVYLCDLYGRKIPFKAAFDSCASDSYICHEAANKLGIKKQKINVPISGLNDHLFTAKSQITAQLSTANDEFRWSVDLLIVPNIADITFSSFINVSKLNIPENIPLADPQFYKPGKIQILLGTEFFFDFLQEKQIRLGNNLFLQDSKFGYLVSGSLEVPKQEERENVSNSCLLSVNALNESIKVFWEIESAHEIKFQSNELDYCNEQFEKTHKRTSSGRYVVEMPLNPEINTNTIPSIDSMPLAQLRLEQLWKRLDRNPEMKGLYLEFMREYEDLGHMADISNHDTAQSGYFLPHHGVYRSQSSTTKLRVVYNASARTPNGFSLNDILLKGGTIQDDLFAIMLRFRKHAYVFSVDIEKMFRQILISPSQTHLQRILWKNNRDAPTRIFELKTLTYGTASAPYLATRVLLQLAKDEGERFPLAFKAMSDFYIDDCLSGSANLEEAKNLQSELTQLLLSGGMTLHKWHSNHPELRVGNAENYSFDHASEENSVKTLGMRWNTSSDSFSYKVSVKLTPHFTKRDVLSEIARIFDPLGLIGPVVTKAKIFLQQLWLIKLDWHEKLPAPIAQEWYKFASSLHFLERVKIPRYVLHEVPERIILHGFADSSSSAFGAVIYLQSVSKDGDISCQLLCSKSRIAPIKTLTIPRLELSACLLLVQLVQKTMKALKLSIERIQLWTDSTIALAWINSSPHLLKTFVSNRVAQIQELSKPQQWRHVASENNPADLISRGLDATDISNNWTWWNGPNFLASETETTDSVYNDTTDIEYIKELKTVKRTQLTLVKGHDVLDNLLNRTNNFHKLIRILSFLFRFYKNCQTSEKVKGPISKEELELAEIILIKWVQIAEFQPELENLNKGKPLSGKSTLISLNPFLDSKGILRVGGRLLHSRINFDQKHQIILPATSRVTQIIFEYLHKKYLHVGPQTLLYYMRQKYWPINGRNIARKTVHNCVTCARNKPKTIEQLMGNPPPERVNISSPFSNTGVDFCGPFFIRYKGQRKGILHKVYVAVFVCMATKAIHLEMVPDLTSQAFISTLKRFFARRGKCSTLFSDNATNFVGANSEIKRLHNLVKHPDEILGRFLASDEITWKFIPPGAPNFGGLWEAGVKSFKHHLRRTVGNSNLIYEEFNTVLVEIEGILNSRPLTPMSSDINDFEALTPAHFLIGRPMCTVAEPELLEIPDNRLSRWQRVEKITQLIWKKWKLDYLNHFQQRHKWQLLKDNVKLGMMVVLRDDNLPKCKWALGRIVELIPGSDGITRVVRVQTAHGIIKRSISKISLLPVHTENV